MKSLNITSFIKLTEKFPDQFRNYCEIIIDPYGSIIPINPSHQETVIRYAMEKENKSRKEIIKEIPPAYSILHYYIDKYNLIAVWYSSYIHGTYINKKPNRFQQRTLNLLVKNGLILDNAYSTREYGLYLERKAMGH